MNASDYEKIAWHSINRSLTFTIRERLMEMRLWEDVKQEIAIVTWQAQKENLPVREVSNLAKRAIYRFLIQNGYRKRANTFNPLSDTQRRLSMQCVVLTGECGLKKCRACQQYWEVETHFSHDFRRADGYALRCKACDKAYQKQYYQNRRANALA